MQCFFFISIYQSMKFINVCDGDCLYTNKRSYLFFNFQIFFSKHNSIFWAGYYNRKNNISFYRHFIFSMFFKNPEEKKFPNNLAKFMFKPSWWKPAQSHKNTVSKVLMARTLLLFCWHWISLCQLGSKQHNVYYVTASNEAMVFSYVISNNVFLLDSYDHVSAIYNILSHNIPSSF